ncbi:MAG: zinc-binding dehydrogenase [Pseudomonadota bacterium]
MTQLPETMRALILKGDGYSGTSEGPEMQDAGQFLEVGEVAVPQLAEGEALVRMKLAVVNPSDLHFVKGEYGAARVAGAPAGFEGVGEVVAGETPLVGQRVSVAGAGIGAWAEYCKVPSQTLIPCHPTLKDTDAAAQVVNPLTAMALFEIGRAGGGIIVTAALSQLGRMLLQLGAEADVLTIAVVRRPEQADAAKAAGASEVIVTDGDWARDAVQIVTTHKARALIDAVGDQAAADLFEMMPAGAVWTSYGKLSPQMPTLNSLGHMIFMGKRIEGFWLTRWFKETPPAEIARLIGEVQARFVDGRWSTGVARVTPLDGAIEALSGALSSEGKTFIDLS